MISNERWVDLLLQTRENLEELEKELIISTKLNKALSEIDKDILNHSRSLSQTLGLIAKQVKDVLGAEHVQILRNMGNNLIIVSSTDEEHISEVVFMDSVSGQAVLQEKAINIVDLGAYSGTYKQFFGSKDKIMQSELAVPIYTHQNKLIFGVINIESTEVNAYNQRDIEIVTDIARQATIAISHSNIIDKSIFSSDIKRLLKTESDINDIKSTLKKYSSNIRKEIKSSYSEFQIAFVDGPFLELVYTTDPNNFGLKVSIDDSVTGDAIQRKKTIYHPDVEKISNFKKLVHCVIRSEIAVPVLIQEQAIAVINVESPKVNAFTDVDIYILEMFAEQTADLLALTRLQWIRYKTAEKSSSDSTVLAIADKVGNYAHRLNTIANSIKYNAAALNDYFIGDIDSVDDKITATTLINNIIESSDDALKIPEELKNNVNSERINPNKVISKIISSNIIKDLNTVAIHFEEGDNIPIMKLFSFDHVVETLLRNSLDAINEKKNSFLPDKSMEAALFGHISLSTRIIDATGTNNRYFVFSIQDDGVGIKTKNITKIYERRYTTKERKTGSGLGFGLWWVKSFITRNRGYIMVYPNHGEGAKFEIRIPL